MAVGIVTTNQDFAIASQEAREQKKGEELANFTLKQKLAPLILLS